MDDYKTRHKDDLPRISELGNKVHPESINTPRQVIPVQTKTKTTKEEIASRILFWGSMINDSETVNLIILKGISPFILQYRQMNSVMIAADHDSLVSFDAILSYDYTKDGLPYIKEGMNKMDRDGNNPLHHACLMVYSKYIFCRITQRLMKDYMLEIILIKMLEMHMDSSHMN